MPCHALNKSLNLKPLLTSSVGPDKVEQRDLAQTQGALEKERLKARHHAQVEVLREKQAEELRAKLKEHKVRGHK